MGNAGVAALDYIELGVSDLNAWRGFAEDVLGLACESSGRALLARMDADVWRIRMTDTGEDDVRALGFRVADFAALEAIGRRLATQGIELRESGAADCAARGVGSLWHCTDPDGLRIELFTGDRPTGEPFVSPRDVQGFVTGDQGFGHVVLMLGDRQQADAFFQNGLGMTVSDYILLGEPGHQITLTFLHCNSRHHTLAYVAVPAPKRLNHFMLQTADMDDVGRALDRAVEAGMTITSSLGRHTNDRMTSFYVRSPSGFDVEYGWGGIEVDDATWTVTSHDATSIWGHKRPHAAG
jgi:2,3-dihydroxybiphenyl 1,2-dioxygenase